MSKEDTIDPVCGMKVDSAKAAAQEEYEGAIFYFCSQGCAAKFRAEPEKYLQLKTTAIGSALSTANTQAEYICPMHPEGSPARTGRLSQVRYGVGASNSLRAADAYAIYLPYAPADHPR